MSGLRRLLLRLYHVIRPSAGEAGLDRELKSHLTLLEDEYERRGLTSEAPRLAARRAVAGVTQAKDLHREARSLVVLGSQRVTRDFDFVLAHPHNRLGALVGLFYDRRLELVSRLDASGAATATIANKKVAVVRLRVDAPASALFFNSTTGLRIDLLFDFPVPAADLAAQAIRLKIRSQVFAVASEADLLRLKRIAATARAVPGDAQDIAFL